MKVNGKTPQAQVDEADDSMQEYRGVENMAAILQRQQTETPVLRATLAASKPAKRKPKTLPNLPPDEYQGLVTIMRDFSLKLGDGEHIESNVTQAVHIMEMAGCDFNLFYSAVVDSWKKTTQKSRVKNRMSYFFTVLKDTLGVSANGSNPTLPN